MDRLIEIMEDIQPDADYYTCDTLVDSGILDSFAILTLINSSTSWFFKSWFKATLSLLLLQSFVALILLITFSIDYSSGSILSKVLCIGSIYALTKANSYMRDLVGGISTEVSGNLNSLRYLIK